MCTCETNLIAQLPMPWWDADGCSPVEWMQHWRHSHGLTDSRHSFMAYQNANTDTSYSMVVNCFPVS